MRDDDDTATENRTKRRKAVAKPAKKVRITKEFLANAKGRSYYVPDRFAAKTRDVHSELYAILEEHGPMCVAEIMEFLPADKDYAAITRQLHLMMHTEQVRGFIEINRSGHERLVLLLDSKTPPGLWDRIPRPGHECENKRRLDSEGKPDPKTLTDEARRQAASQMDAKMKLAQNLLDRAADMPKRQEALALEMVRQATTLLDGK